MNLKKSLIATGIWMLVVVALSAFAIWFVLSQDLPDAQLKERMTMLGSGIGLFASIGLAAIWLPFASRMGAEQRAKRERAARKKKRRSQ
jgi:hypothetical protein